MGQGRVEVGDRGFPKQEQEQVPGWVLAGIQETGSRGGEGGRDELSTGAGEAAQTHGDKLRVRNPCLQPTAEEETDGCTGRKQRSTFGFQVVAPTAYLGFHLGILTEV